MAGILDALTPYRHTVSPVRPGLNGTSIVDARVTHEETTVGVGLRRTVTVDTHWDGRTKRSSFWTLGSRVFGVKAGDYRRAA